MAAPKKKQWYEIIAPAIFHKQSLGDVYLYEPQKAVGRVITVNLMSLTNDPKKQNLEIKFKIEGVQDNKLDTSVLAYQVSSHSIKRFVRRGRDRVDDSFMCRTADNKSVRVKTMLLTVSNTKKSVLTLLQKEAKKFLVEEISKTGYDNFISDLVSYKTQSQLKKQLKKVFPLRACEVRVVQIEEPKIGSKTEKPAKKKKPEDEPKEEGSEEGVSEEVPEEEKEKTKRKKPKKTTEANKEEETTEGSKDDKASD